MTNTQPKALIFADWLEGSKDTINKEAAKELRRLHEVNAELLNALQFFAKAEINDDNCASLEVAQRRVRTFAANAIAKAEEQA